MTISGDFPQDIRNIGDQSDALSSGGAGHVWNVTSFVLGPFTTKKGLDISLKFFSSALKIAEERSIAGEAQNFRVLVKALLAFETYGQGKLTLFPEEFSFSALFGTKTWAGLCKSWLDALTIVSAPISFVRQSRVLDYALKTVGVGGVEVYAGKNWGAIESVVAWPVSYLKPGTKFFGFHRAFNEWLKLSEEAGKEELNVKRLELFKTGIEVLREAAKAGLVPYLGPTVVSVLAIVSAGIGGYQLYTRHVETKQVSTMKKEKPKELSPFQEPTRRLPAEGQEEKLHQSTPGKE